MIAARWLVALALAGCGTADRKDSGEDDSAADTDTGADSGGDSGADSGDSGDSGDSDDTDTDTGCTEVDGFADADGDGHGDPATPRTACDAVGTADDCDDADATVHPGAEETCGDGVDQDCAATAACRRTGEIEQGDAGTLLPAVLEGWSYGGDLDADGAGDFVAFTPTYDMALWYGPLVGDLSATAPDEQVPAGTSYAASFAIADAGAGERRLAMSRSDSSVTAAVILYQDRRPDVQVGVMTGDFGHTYSYPQRFVNVGDSDGDGVDELVTTSTNSARGYVVPASLAETITSAEASATVANASWAVHALGDVDGDGLADLGFTDNGATAWVQFGPLAGAMDADDVSVTITNGNTFTGHGMAWCAEARLLAVSSLVAYDVGLFAGVAEGATLDGLDPEVLVRSDGIAYTYDVHCHDLDGDGGEDLAVGAYSYSLEVFWGLPTADVDLFSGDLAIDVAYGTPLRSADADGDGIFELAVGEHQFGWGPAVYALAAE